MGLARNVARLTGRVSAPLIRTLRLTPAVNGAETFLAFLSGRGGGSGWDMSGQTKAIAKFVPPGGAVIFDVGANNGEWSRLMASARGESGDRFHLFECAPYCFPGIEQRSGAIPNLKLSKVAVSSSEGTATLHLPTVGSGLASLHERHDVSVVQQTYTELEVPTIALDDYIEKNKIERVDLLKIDIEGHELHALSGAKKSLANGTIRAVAFEFGSANVNSRSFFVDFWRLFTDLGFKLCRIIPGAGVLEVDRYSETLEYFRGSSNYIAFLPDQGKQR